MFGLLTWGLTVFRIDKLSFGLSDQFKCDRISFRTSIIENKFSIRWIILCAGSLGDLIKIEFHIAIPFLRFNNASCVKILSY